MILSANLRLKAELRTAVREWMGLRPLFRNLIWLSRAGRWVELNRTGPERFFPSALISEARRLPRC